MLIMKIWLLSSQPKNVAKCLAIFLHEVRFVICISGFALELVAEQVFGVP